MRKLIQYALLLCLGWSIAIAAPPVWAQAHPSEPSSQVSAPTAHVLIEQGRTFYQQGAWAQAIAAWETALTSLPTDPVPQATVHTYLGMAYQKQGHHTAAATALETSLQQLALLPEESRAPLQAQALNALGQLALAQGRPEAALTHWQQTTVIYQTLDYPEGVTGSLMNQARALAMSGHYRRACQTLLTAIAVAEPRCEFKEPEAIAAVMAVLEAETDPMLKLLGLTNLGNVLRLNGYLAPAQQLLEESVAIAHTLDRPDALTTTLLSLGRVEQALYRRALYRYEQTNRPADQRTAVEFAIQALAHYRTVEDLTQGESGTPFIALQTAAQTLDLLTELKTNAALLGQPLEDLQPDLPTQIQKQLQLMQALPLIDLPPSRPVIDSQVSLAQSLLTLWEDAQQAKATIAISLTAEVMPLLARAHEQAIALADIEAQSQVLGTLGHVYEVWGNFSRQSDAWREAQQQTQTALVLAQSIHADHLAYQWQWQLGRLVEPEQAITYYQAAVTTLASVRRDLRAVEADARFALRDKVEPLYRELVSLLLASPATNPTASQPSQASLQQAIQEIDALQLARLEDFLNCNLTQQVALDESQTDPTAAIVYPIILPEQLAVVVRLPQSDVLQFYRTQLPAAEVNAALDSLRRELERPFLSDTFWARSQQVYDWLIRPLETRLADQSIDTLVFVSDGKLRNVPLAALHDGQQYLIEKYAVALSPSLQLPVSQPLTEVGTNTLAFGLSETRPDFWPHSGFSPLKNVESELAGIRAKVPSRNLLNQDFTSSALQTLVSEASASIVHLATHGQFSSDPSETFLLAWDRRITLADLSQLLNRSPDQTAIELLVLSACRTATGDSRATLGLAGVAIQSGARSTLASLWNVNDVATAELMGHLYQALSDPAQTFGRAEALRQAQLTLLNTPGYQAPFYWSAFVLVGNWR